VKYLCVFISNIVLRRIIPYGVGLKSARIINVMGIIKVVVFPSIFEVAYISISFLVIRTIGVSVKYKGLESKSLNSSAVGYFPFFILL